MYYDSYMNKIDKQILTAREYEVLKLIAEGLNNHQIADVLAISIHTVKAHVESIYRKFNVHNKVQTVIYAFFNNYLDINDY